MDIFLKEMKNTYFYAKSSIENSYKAFEFIDTDFRLFLETFFEEDATENSFLLRIFSESDEKLRYFQDFILERTCKYLKSIINVNGLTYSYNSSKTFPDIEIKTGDILLVSINVFYKEVTVYENNYLKDIVKNIEKKEKKKQKLEAKYENLFNKYGNQSLVQSVVAIGTGKSKKIKTKVEEITYAILELEEEISYLKAQKIQLEKEFQDIQYIQDRIKSRILSKLNYDTIVD